MITQETTFGHSKIRPFCFYMKSRPANAPLDSPHQKMHLRASDTESRDDWLAAIGLSVRARKELMELAPRESLLARDVQVSPTPYKPPLPTQLNPRLPTPSQSEKGRFISHSAASVATDVTGYSSRTRSWRLNKRKEVESAPALSIKVCGTVSVVQKAKGSSLLPDPYCVVSVGSTVVQTQTKKQTLNAQWDER